MNTKKETGQVDPSGDTEKLHSAFPVRLSTVNSTCEVQNDRT
jgi:hypothetical protein